MPGLSATLAAKRALVKLLRTLAVPYGVGLDITRDSSDADVTRAFKKVAAKAHPDKGGKLQDSQQLHATRDAWHV